MQGGTGITSKLNGMNTNRAGYTNSGNKVDNLAISGNFTGVVKKEGSLTSRGMTNNLAL